ncbi:MAG: VOC family protein [Actinobacteria bacterium]|nr:MAG: VOC family protein [Actinomycetota bacterium]
MRLTFVRLLVDDYAACFRFYRDVMEFPVTFGNETSGYADFDAGADVHIAVFDRCEQMEQLGGEDQASGAQAALIFEVVDVDSAIAGLRARGARVAREPADRADWGIRVAYVRDPAANLIELNQPIPIKG